jgi:hypothetical protein
LATLFACETGLGTVVVANSENEVKSRAKSELLLGAGLMEQITADAI